MSRTYNRRAAIRKRNESIQDIATTVALVAGALVLCAFTIFLGAGLGLMLGGAF